MSHNTAEPAAALDPLLPGVPDRLLRSRMLAGLADYVLGGFTSVSSSSRFIAPASGPTAAAAR